MNLLRSVLQSLRRPSRTWNIIFTPDPKKCTGYEFGRGIWEYRIQLQNDIDLKKYLFRQSGFYGGVANVGSDRAKKRKPEMSKWLKIVDIGLKNEDGQTVRQVLTDIANKFPSYELESEQGCEAAIRDIEDRLTGMGLFEEVAPGIIYSSKKM